MPNKYQNKKIIKYLTKTLLVIFLANFLFYPQAILSQSKGGDTNAINQQLQEKKDRINKLQQEIDKYQKNIDYHKHKSLSLANQISILNNEINKLETEVELKNNQIDQTNLEITETKNKIANTENNIKTQKIYLTRFIQQMNQMDKKTEIELLLTVNSFSDYYNHLYTLEVLQNNTSQALVKLKSFKDSLEIQVAGLKKKKKTLENLKQELENKKTELSGRSYAKQSLLTESRNSEARFRSLVSKLKAEQASINAEIVALEKQIRNKMSGNKKWQQGLGGSSDFIWPVPSHYITCYFHDPDYPFRYLFEHPGIDIKSAQGSPIRATASGYVAKVRINGIHYAYIMLIHANGFSSVYGHISKSFVKEDQFVSQGEIIGLSGGMPGTIGAGRLTTGPHLHFEIRKNGIPVNPLDYLP